MNVGVEPRCVVNKPNVQTHKVATFVQKLMMITAPRTTATKMQVVWILNLVLLVVVTTVFTVMVHTAQMIFVRVVIATEMPHV